MPWYKRALSKVGSFFGNLFSNVFKKSNIE